MKKILSFVVIISLLVSSQLKIVLAVPVDDGKEQILNKMLNSVENFEYASGQFTLTSIKSDVIKKVDYQVDNSKQKKTYEKIYAKELSNTQRNQDFEVTERFYDGAHYVLNKESQNARTTENELEISLLTNGLYLNTTHGDIQSRIETRADGSSSYFYRNNDLGLSECKISILPEEIVFNFLSNQTLWTIEGEENYLGYKAIRINGELSMLNKDRYDAETFYMIVNKDTGILLEFGLINSDGKSMESLITDQISINQPIEQEVFNLYSEELNSFDNENKKNDFSKEIAPFFVEDTGRSIIIDNDQSTIYGYSSTSAGFNSSYYTGSGYANDYRLATPYQIGSYQWFFTSNIGWRFNSLNVEVYLSNGDFTSSYTWYELKDWGADPYSNTFYGTSLNQNYSPIGWNVIAKNITTTTSGHLTLLVCPGSSSNDGLIGIDAAYITY